MRPDETREDRVCRKCGKSVPEHEGDQSRARRELWLRKRKWRVPGSLEKGEG